MSGRLKRIASVMVLALGALAATACSSRLDDTHAAGALEAGDVDAGSDAIAPIDTDASGADAGVVPADDAAIDAPSESDSFVDPRDGQTYRTITFGPHTWLARNLAYESAGSYCYDDDPAQCEQYGRLYTFTVARTVCPQGWHLGSDSEWKTLETALGMASDQLSLEGYSTPRGTDEGTQMKDAAGFGAVMAGFRTGATYEALEDRTYFWTSSTRGSEVWRRRVAASEPTVFRFTNPPADFAISVRCVRD